LVEAGESTSSIGIPEFSLLEVLLSFLTPKNVNRSRKQHSQKAQFKTPTRMLNVKFGQNNATIGEQFFGKENIDNAMKF
jgi:hypothetical protein